MTLRFFVDTGDGYELWETEEEARAAAQSAIEYWRTIADPEWPEEVERVCWGEIREMATAKATQPDEFGSTVDYFLK